VVRGQEYFLCCKGCDKKLQADPDKYLEKDGTPKNAKK
jgi:YHS domain-containing protein